jgi:hypothetical protein
MLDAIHPPSMQDDVSKVYALTHKAARVRCMCDMSINWNKCRMDFDELLQHSTEVKGLELRTETGAD